MDDHDEEDFSDEHDEEFEEAPTLSYRLKAIQNKYPLKIYEYNIGSIMSLEDIDNINIGDNVYFRLKGDNEYYMGIKISPTEFIHGENDIIEFDTDEFEFFNMAKKVSKDFLTPDDIDDYVIPKKNKVAKTDFIGYEDITEGGLTYLLYKHDNGCVVLDNTVKNAEMRYRNGNIEVKKGFYNRIISCLRSDKRFVLWRLTLISPNNKEAHANLMMYDKNTRTIERFDPHGLSSIEWVSDERVDYEVQKKLSYIQDMVIVEYLRPQEICPLGPQSLENFVRDKISSDPGGFCAAWSLWYADLRLSNPDISQSDIILLAVNNIEEDIIMDEYNNMSFTSFIRNYAEFIYRIAKIFQEYGDSENLDKVKRIIMTDKPLGLLINGSRSLKRGNVELSDYRYEQINDPEDMLDKVLMIVEYEGNYYEGIYIDGIVYFYTDYNMVSLPLLENIEHVWLVTEKI